jgi:hypothetical protein
MIEEPELTPVELLVLARLLPVGEKGDGLAKIRKDLDPLLDQRWSGSDLAETLDRTVHGLAARGLVEHLPAKRKSAAPALRLSSQGRAIALGSLGVSELPVKPKPTWAALKKSLILAKALKLPPPGKAFATAAGFKAAVLGRRFALPLPDYPDLKSVRLELTRKLLEMGSKEKITLQSVQAALFARELGEQRQIDAKKVLDRLVSKQVGARRDDDKEVRDAVLRGWLGESADRPRRDATPSPPLALADFVHHVKSAAEHCESGRFGENKIFIIHVWRKLQEAGKFPGMDLPGFKQLLAQANNARLLDLSRADLVQAMNPDDVRLSEVHFANAAFHFIRI